MGCFRYLGKAAVWVGLICAFQPKATGSPQVALLQVGIRIIARMDGCSAPPHTS